MHRFFDNISLDEAVYNARIGISIKKCLANQSRKDAIKICTVGLFLAGLAALVFAISSPREVPLNLKSGLFGGEYAAYCGFNLK